MECSQAQVIKKGSHLRNKFVSLTLYQRHILTFLTEADQESVSPRNTIKKNGPQRSQSLKAFPGSSRYGLGNTTNFRLLTILDRSLFTVSQTGSVSVFGGDPNASEENPWRTSPTLGAEKSADETGRTAGTDCFEGAEAVAF